MFDGIDVITLVTGDAAPLLALYTGPLGFQVMAQGPLAQPAQWRARWQLAGAGPLNTWVLGKPGSTGGWLRVAEDLSAPPSLGPATIARPGPHALDFYVRGLPGLYASLTARGAPFRSPPHDAVLPGAGFTVQECLLEVPLGLVHALVGYLPERHRCVLGNSPRASVSEAVAVVWVVPDIEEALALLTGPLAASVYLDQVFRGPQTERLMALPPGTTFRMALARGPGRRNARLEFIQQTPAPSDPAPPVPGPAVILGCGVPDVAALHARLANERYGQVSPITTLAGPGAAGPAFAFTASCGVVFEFFERTGLA